MNYVLVATTTLNVDFTFTSNINEFKGFLEDSIADFELGWGSPSTTSFLLAFTSPSSWPSSWPSCWPSSGSPGPPPLPWPPVTFFLTGI